MKKFPDMISGDWHPTPDPSGRRVRFTTFLGEEMEGTVVAVEYEDDQEPTLYVDVTSPAEHRGERGVCAREVEWLDADQPPWVVSRTPSGRWVLFHEENNVERSGCIMSVDSRHRHDATLAVLVAEPDFFGVVHVDWRRVKWLPA